MKIGFVGCGNIGIHTAEIAKALGMRVITYDAKQTDAAKALDVVSTEPIHGDNPLLKAKNCIITPHMSWGAKGSRQRIMDTTVENVKAWLGGAPQNVVNQ